MSKASELPLGQKDRWSPKSALRLPCSSGDANPEREEELAEYICDATGCTNPASHVLGCVKELGLAVIVCNEHAAVRNGSPPPQGR